VWIFGGEAVFRVVEIVVYILLGFMICIVLRWSVYSVYVHSKGVGDVVLYTMV
jgi:hypothetical protein